ncbi:MAG: amino acid adenylation domain-containing protein, partial [Myxococcota bacterium]
MLERLDGKRGALLDRVLRDERGPVARDQQIVVVPGDRGPLSRAQRRLYYLRKLDQTDASYNMTLAMHLRGPISAEALARAVDDLVERHAALRTRIAEGDGEPYQEIVPSTGAPLQVAACRDLDEARARIAAEEARPFALDAGLFARAFLYRCGADDHVFALVIDHIVADGWSVGVLSKDLSALYDHHLRGRPLALPTLPVRFLDHAAWDDARPLELADSLAHWRQAMDGAEASVLPLDHPRPEVRPPVSGACHERDIPADVRRGLEQLAHATRTSLFDVLSAAFALFLKKYAFTDDVVIGTPAAGRFRWETLDTVGFFVNTVPLRYALDGQTSFAALLRHVHDVNQRGFAHQEVPYEQIVAETHPNRRRGRELVNLLVCLQNLDLPDLRFGDVVSEPLGFARRTVRFDLELHYFLRGDGLLLHVAYDASLFRPATIEALAASVGSFLAQLAAGEDALAAIRFPADVPRSEALAARPVSRDPARFAPLAQIVVERTRQAPEAVAVRFGDVAVTYAALCDWADQIAAALGDAPAEARIGLVFREGATPVAASLGVWWSGRTLVPIDPDFPDDRIAGLVRDARLAVVLDPTPDDRLRQLVGAVPLLAVPDPDPLARRHGPPAAVDPDAPAYLLYTSGSTGTPRGVLVTTGNLAGLAALAETRFAFGPADRWTWWHSCSFDVAIWDVWGAIATGGTVYPMTRWQKRDLGELAAFVDANGITVLAQTPSVFYELAEALAARATSAGGHGSLRYVFLGGEAVEPQRLQRWFRAFGDAAPEVHNGYGITETTVYTSFKRLTLADAHRRWVASPIGAPLANVSLRIEDAFGDVVPVGGFGELVIGGESVSAGYLDRPEITAAKFVARDWAGERLRAYRSGDLVRLGPDGELAIAGRIDHQVQLRGIRVEPGEIEARILENDRVCAVVVQSRNLDETEVRSLVAYVVPASGSARGWTSATGDWARVFDAAYAEPSATGHGEWISSFTGLPYTPDEMAEWLDGTIAAILALRPRRILEIGCGGGLLVRRLVLHVDTYVGIDVSKDAVARCAAIAAALGAPPDRVRFEVGDAHAVAGLELEPVDLVVVNSVVQYFPDAAYLARALDLALDRLVPDGAIFVGDVRDLRRRDAFHLDVERARDPSRTDGELARAAARRADRDGELSVDPDLFARYGEAAALVDVTVRSKDGRHRTEMNGYRFDAILRRSAASHPVGAARVGALAALASAPTPP